MTKPLMPPGQDPGFIPPGHGGTPPGQVACFARGTMIAVPMSEVVRRGDVRQIERADDAATRLLGFGLAFSVAV